MNIQKLMTRTLVTIPADETVARAAEIMNDKRIRHLPVTDEEGDIIGMLSDRDVAHFPQSALMPVQSLMRTPVMPIDEEAPIRQAVLRMLENKISSLIVIDENYQVKGIVTTDDLLWHLAEILEEKPAWGLTLRQLVDRRTLGEVAGELSNAGI